MERDIRAGAVRLSTALFPPIRKLLGPLYRRRPSLEHDQNDDLPPLPAPWHDERWFRGGPPPRGHNRIEPLIDGEEYFRDLLAALLEARERVTIAGWCLTPLMALQRATPEGESILADVLRDVSARADVYVLLWSGAQALFEPTDRMVEEARAALLKIAPRVHCEVDRRAAFSHDHHQKAVTVDGRIAYVGGMDLSTFQGDRWDTQAHALRCGLNWHDVQARLEGELVQDVEENFCQRWNAATDDRPAGVKLRPSDVKLHPLPQRPIEPAWDTPAQIVRSIPIGFYPFAPNGEYGIFHALTTAIRRAQKLVYLENQYIWAPEVVEALVEAINRPRSTPFRVVLVLPARAYTGKYDNDEHVRLLSRVDGGRGIFHAYSLFTGGPAIGPTGYRYEPIYVHAKVSIVDDEWFSLGSANLNQRGLALDTEMNVQSIAPDLARALRVRLWAEHLALRIERVTGADPIALVDTEWRAAAENLEACIRSSGVPVASKVRTYVPARNPASRLLDVIQGVTLEH
jgi:phosphatidylserine/phosphatidylglycerophosphate/cardiolipin synthase-like enzyme